MPPRERHADEVLVALKPSPTAGARSPFRARFMRPYLPAELLICVGYYIPGTSNRVQVRFVPGLEGGIAFETQIAEPDRDGSVLRYRGVDIEELDRRLVAHKLPPAGLRPLRLFRLPYGRGGADVARLLNSQGLAVIQWDVVGEGGQGGQLGDQAHDGPQALGGVPDVFRALAEREKEKKGEVG